MEIIIRSNKYALDSYLIQSDINHSIRNIDMALTHHGYRGGSDNLQYSQKDDKPGRFYFSELQKERLNQEFRCEQNPSKEWREELASELQVPVRKIDMWYGARRQKYEIAREKKQSQSSSV